MRQIAIIAISLSLAACATSGELAPTPQEEALALTLKERSIIPATKEEREAITSQDLLTQAAFWAEAYDLNPGDKEAAQKLSQTLYDLNNVERSAEIARQALALYPEDTTLKINLGVALTASGRGTQAIEYLVAATNTAPSDWKLINILGVAYDQAGRPSEARRQFEQALLLSGGDVKALNNLAVSYMLAGNPEKAESLLRKAVDKNIASAEVRQNLALALALQSRFTEAEAMSLNDMTREMTAQNLSYVRALMNTGRRYDAVRQLDTPSLP